MNIPAVRNFSATFRGISNHNYPVKYYNRSAAMTIASPSSIATPLTATVSAAGINVNYAEDNSSNDIQRRFRSNRSRRGLYDGKDIRSGNNLSFSMKHTKRTFKPNVFKKRVYSEILNEMIPFHLTTSALRSIDNAGGLDNYLLTSRHVTAGEGLAAKSRIIERLKYVERVEKRRQQDEQVSGDGIATATSD